MDCSLSDHGITLGLAADMLEKRVKQRWSSFSHTMVTVLEQWDTQNQQDAASDQIVFR